MAESQILCGLAQRLGVTSDRVIRKAEEFMRLADVRSACSSLSSLSLSGSCKAVMCLELACQAHGEQVDKASVLQVSGMRNKKVYMGGLRALESLLGLQSNLTVTDLTVQFGCPDAKHLTMQVLKRFEEQQIDTDTVEYSQALFNTAAMFAVCRRQKQKVDKTKMVDLTGVKRAMFDKLVAQMDSVTETILKEQTKGKPASKRASSFMDEIEKAAASASKKAVPSDGLHPEEEEPYEVWKDRILQAAYKALDKPYTPKAIS